MGLVGPRILPGRSTIQRGERRLQAVPRQATLGRQPLSKWPGACQQATRASHCEAAAGSTCHQGPWATARQVFMHQFQYIRNKFTADVKQIANNRP